MSAFVWVALGIGAFVAVLIVFVEGCSPILLQRGKFKRRAWCDERPTMFSTKNCPVCGRPLQADWCVCPHDGTRVG
jgi:hypothetical protein